MHQPLRDDQQNIVLYLFHNYLQLGKKILFLPCLFRAKFRIDLWCNGSTTDFGSVSQGSNPCRSTKTLVKDWQGFFYLFLFINYSF